MKRDLYDSDFGRSGESYGGFAVIALVAILCALGIVGAMDYAAERELQCTNYATPHIWDPDTDECKEIKDAE